MADIRTLRTSDELDRLWERSHERPVWLFKHSLTCSISRRAYSAYLGYADTEAAERADLTLLEIQPSRELSAEVAERTGVRHESPQAILLRDGRPVWDASHGRITTDVLSQAVDGLAAPRDVDEAR